MPLSPKIVGAKDGEFWNVVGDRIRCLLDGKSTGNQFSLFEVRTPPGAGSPPHIHHHEDETFYIIEGEMEFWIDGKAVKAGPGMTVFGPRDVPHCFRNVGTKAAYMLMLATPAGLEAFFEECSRVAPQVPPPPGFFELCGRFKIELVSAS